MASDLPLVRTSGDASAADDAPSTSSAPPAGRRVKLMCAYGGKFLPRPVDGCLRYAGGETRIINLRRDSSLPEFLRKMGEAYGGPVAVRYQLPEEDLDALISVSTPEDLDNMLEEVDKIAENNPSAKLRVFLFSPAELAGASVDQHYSGKDVEDQNTRYIEAVNGVGNRLPRKDSMASVSTQNSDGAIVAEVAADGLDEGTSLVLPPPNATNAHDQSKPIFTVQNMPDLPSSISSIEQNEGFNTTESEFRPAAPYLQQSHVDPHNSQFVNSQPFAVSGLHSQVNLTPLPPPSCAPAAHGTLPTFSQAGNGVPTQRREVPFLEEKTSVGSITKVPSDPIFPVQNMPDLPNKNEVFNATHSDLPPVSPYLQQPYVVPHNSQFMSSQSLAVGGLHSQVNISPLPPPSYIAAVHGTLSQTSQPPLPYVPAMHGTLPSIFQPGNVFPVQRREDPVLEEKTGVGNTTKVPSDLNFSVQNMPSLPSASSSIDQNEIFNTTHSEPPPVSSYSQKPYIDQHPSQFMSSQSSAVGVLHSQVNVSPLPPPALIAAMHVTPSPTSQPSNVMPVQGREDTVLEEKTTVGNTAKVPSDPIFAVQNMHNLPTAISSIDQNEIFKATQSKLPLVAPYLQQPYVDPYKSQFMSSQPFAVAGLHSHVNVAPLPPQSYVPDTHGTLAPVSQSGNEAPVQKREDILLEEKTSVGKISKVANDPKVQLLLQPQLPPLPPAHFLMPKGQALKLEECSICQTTLPHAHSDTVLNDQANGYRFSNSEAKPVLQSHHSGDTPRMRVPQVDVIRALEDNVTETNPGNLVSVSPLMSNVMPCNNEKPNAVVTNNLDHAKALGQESTALKMSSPAAHVAVTNLQTAHQESTMQKNQVIHALGPIRENTSHSNFSCQTTLSAHADEILNGHPKSSWEEDLQGQPQFPRSKIQLKQESTQPFVADISSLRNPNLQEGMLAQFYSYKPVEDMVGSLYVNTFGPDALTDQTKQFVVPKMATSKDSRPDILLSIKEKSIVAKPLDEPTMPLNDLLLTGGVVPNGNASLSAELVASTGQNLLNIQGPQATRASDTFHTTENNLIANVGMSDYTYNSMMHKNLTEDRKDVTSKSQMKEVFCETIIPGDDQIITNAEPFQGQISSNSFFNDDPQKILGSAPVLSPSPANVSSLESIVMEDMRPLHTKDSVDMVLEDVSPYLSQSSKDLRTELIRPLKDYEHIEQGMPASAEETVAPIVYLSKPLINDFVPHHPNNEETGTTENNVERTDEKDRTIKDTKKPEKLNNGFPNIYDIERHLQVIKNSDLEELRELGSGTFGTVYHGKWRGSDVAIKRLNELVFKGKPSDQERARADFWNEACKLSSLHHPNVLAFYGIVLDGPGGTIATVTEFMVNGSLRNALVKNDKTLDWRKRLLIAMDVAFGMEYLHSRNIIHFDLKSDNLLVNLRDPQRPICKVGDLGLSRVKFETLMSGGMRGTLPWMAPELLDGKTKYTEKIDVYSFGIVMWELLTGEEPYTDLHYGAIIGGIIKNTLRPTVPETCDAEWRSLMEQCWSVEPTERPNFTEIASRLRAMGASIPRSG